MGIKNESRPIRKPSRLACRVATRLGLEAASFPGSAFTTQGPGVSPSGVVSGSASDSEISITPANSAIISVTLALTMLGANMKGDNGILANQNHVLYRLKTSLIYL